MMTRHIVVALALLLSITGLAGAAPASDAELAKLLVGQWQSARRVYCYWEDGTWRLSPESGITGGTWQIKQGRLLITYTDGLSVSYHIVELDDKRFVTRDDKATFKHTRVIAR